MIPPLKAVRRILWGNITINDRVVPVIQRDYPYDKSPCITIDDSGGSRFLQRHILTEEYPLPREHPQFNESKPFKKFPQQVLREFYETTLNINVWSDTGDEREEINKQLLRLFYEAQSDHCRFCNNYVDGECGSLGGVCLGMNTANDKRGVKHQCPNPDLYKYQNIFTTYNLERDTFHLDQPFSLNDTSKEAMIYRSVFKLHTSYFTDHIIGGMVSDNIVLDIENEPVSYFVNY